MTPDLLDELAAAIERWGTIVRVTVIEVSGSTPRDVGAAMIVAASETTGTIGGGRLEYSAIEAARNMLAETGELSRGWRRETREYLLGPDLEQCCGGFARLFFEVFTIREARELERLRSHPGPDAVVLRPLANGVPLSCVTDRKGKRDWPMSVARKVQEFLSGAARPRAALISTEGTAWFLEPARRDRIPLVIYGAGHVGRALVRVLADTPFDLVWVDTDQARFPENPVSSARIVVTDDPAEFAAGVDPGAYHLVLTYSHAIDYAVCRVLLERNDFGFLGLIGSKTKRARFLKRWREEGIGEHALRRLTCPIGIDAVAGKEPAVIAISVAAQLINKWEQDARRRGANETAMTVHRERGNATQF